MVIFTSPNVVKIDIEYDSFDSTLSNVVQINVEIEVISLVSFWLTFVRVQNKKACYLYLLFENLTKTMIILWKEVARKSR